jgi:hypothetical protein
VAKRGNAASAGAGAEAAIFFSRLCSSATSLALQVTRCSCSEMSESVRRDGGQEEPAEPDSAEVPGVERVAAEAGEVLGRSVEHPEHARVVGRLPSPPAAPLNSATNSAAALPALDATRAQVRLPLRSAPGSGSACRAAPLTASRSTRFAVPPAAPLARRNRRRRP